MIILKKVIVVAKNPQICNCPYTDWCHDVRQWLRAEFRKYGHEKTVEDCDFYKMIQEKETKKGPTK